MLEIDYFPRKYNQRTLIVMSSSPRSYAQAWQNPQGRFCILWSTKSTPFINFTP